MTEVSVVIGNYEGAAVIGDCFDSLENQTLAPSEVIVTDAGSTDGSDADAARRGARVIRLRNLGLGHLYNRGTAAATAPYVFLVNNDVALEERCLELLVAALDERPEAFACDPVQLTWDGSDVVQRRTTLARGSFMHALLPGFRLDMTVAGTAVEPTVCTNGGAMLVRREQLLELGGFDETFFMDFEDLDLGWRAWLHGRASYHVPEAVVRHRVGAVTTSAILPRRLVSAHHNLIRFALTCLPRTAAARIVATELVRVGVHPRAVVPALAQIARELPEIARRRRAQPPRRDALLTWFLDGMPGDTPGWAVR